jgi:hypothetical protein
MQIVTIISLTFVSILLGAILGYMYGKEIGEIYGRRKEREHAAHDKRPSVRCPPERIQPNRGACGLNGCLINTPHSHVKDLVKRLRGE